MNSYHLLVAILCCNIFTPTQCWTTEDLELFDLVESTSQNFYDVLGVDKKASASDIRKAYRRLSTQYHPDKNKKSDAEETFRKIAAIADVLRNDERRKTYDLVLATGLPDWRMPIYYYRRVRNMGLLDLCIFLFLLATFAQYVFAWSVYWEKKYEVEEMVMSRLKKKAKHLRKNQYVNLDEDLAASEEISSLPKPRCTDLFPVQLFYMFINLIKASPSYVAYCREIISKPKVVESEEDEEPEVVETRVKVKKHIKPVIPDYTNETQYGLKKESAFKDSFEEERPRNKKLSKIQTENDLLEFKKVLKKFPNGTLQRWEKVAEYLDCSVSEVTTMVKQLKNQEYSKSIPLSLQGVTGTEKENFGSKLYEAKGGSTYEITEFDNTNGEMNSEHSVENPSNNGHLNNENTWRQEEQQSLEVALQKFPKETTARWDRIADYVQTKSKEECVVRYRILVQQIKKKKNRSA